MFIVYNVPPFITAIPFTKPRKITNINKLLPKTVGTKSVKITYNLKILKQYCGPQTIQQQTRKRCDSNLSS